MAARSPARFLAPLALLGFVLALLLIVSHSSSDSGSGGNEAKTTQEQPTPTSASGKGGDASSAGKSKGPRFYVVKVGDTPSAIAEKTGVSLSTIETLNPSLDPQALSPGARIKLRK